MKNTIIAIIVIAVLVIGGYVIMKKAPDAKVPTGQATTTQPLTTGSTTVPQVQDKTQTVIGKSVQGREITAYHYGAGDTKLLFIGGVHGGYAWNTSLVAYQLMDYLKKDESVIPEGIEVTVIPAVNPDGLVKVTGKEAGFTAADVSTAQDVVVSGRFNANNVDLNRNFDCGWQATGVWQSKPVSGGTAVFSEPESKAVRDFVTAYQPDAVVVWYSAAGGVYASTCDGKPVAAATTEVLNTYAGASGYPAFKSFDFYETSGDMTNWLAKIGVPAVSVLLTDHTNTEWEKNKKGIEALFTLFSK